MGQGDGLSVRMSGMLLLVFIVRTCIEIIVKKSCCRTGMRIGGNAILVCQIQ
jgi:hypothetical protein